MRGRGSKILGWSRAHPGRRRALLLDNPRHARPSDSEGQRKPTSPHYPLQNPCSSPPLLPFTQLTQTWLFAEISCFQLRPQAGFSHAGGVAWWDAASLWERVSRDQTLKPSLPKQNHVPHSLLKDFWSRGSMELLPGGCWDGPEGGCGHIAGQSFDGLIWGWVLPLLWAGKRCLRAVTTPVERWHSSSNLNKYSSTVGLNKAFIFPILCKEWRKSSTQEWALTFSEGHSLWSVSKDPTESSWSSPNEVWKVLQTHEYCVSNHVACFGAKTLKRQTRSWRTGFLLCPTSSISKDLVLKHPSACPSIIRWSWRHFESDIRCND